MHVTAMRCNARDSLVLGRGSWTLRAGGGGCVGGGGMPVTSSNFFLSVCCEPRPWRNFCRWPLIGVHLVRSRSLIFVFTCFDGVVGFAFIQHAGRELGGGEVIYVYVRRYRVGYPGEIDKSHKQTQPAYTYRTWRRHARGMRAHTKEKHDVCLYQTHLLGREVFLHHEGKML